MADLMTASIVLRKPYVPVTGSACAAATGRWPRVPLQQGLHRAAKRLGGPTRRNCAASSGDEARTCASR